MSTSNAATTDPSRNAFGSAGWTPRLVLSLIAILFVIEAVGMIYTAVATALPAISKHFETTSGGWMLTAFALVGAITNPLFGKLADIHGKRRMIVVALAFAAVGDLLVTLAPAFWVMVVGQALHGCIIACMFLGYSLMRDVYPQKVVPFASSLSLTGTGLLASLVPFAIGALLDNYGFRAVFLFDLIWVVVMGAAVVLLTPETPLRLPAKIDALGSFLLGAGLATILLPVSMGSDWGWTSLRIIGLFVLGIALMAVYVVVALRRKQPVVDLRTFARRPILFAAVTGGIAYGINPINQILLPILAMTPAAVGISYGLGLNASGYAWVSGTAALAGVIGGILVGLVVRHTGPRKTMYLGLVLLAGGALLAAFEHDTLWKLICAALVLGLGNGFSFGSIPNVVIRSTPESQQGSISAAVNMCTSIVGSVTPVVAYALMTPGGAAAAHGAAIYTGSGVQHALFLSGGLALVALLIGATLLRSRRTAATEQDAAPAPARAA